MESLILASIEHSAALQPCSVYTAPSTVHPVQPTRPDTSHNTMASVYAEQTGDRLATPPTAHDEGQNSHMSHNPNPSPAVSPGSPKNVAFELLVSKSLQQRARLPMRVQIYPHDTTDSIVTTVKNFYGLYNGPGGAKGISFEDEQGSTLIARYENLRDKMNVYVRVIEEPAHASAAYGVPSYQSVSPTPGHQDYYNGDGNQMLPQQAAHALTYGQGGSRPSSRASHKRSPSPYSGRGRRSDSANGNVAGRKGRSGSGFKNRNSSTHGGFQDMYDDGVNGYSSGDDAPGSVCRSEQLGNTEISVDNIVEGGRRKRAKFESSVSYSNPRAVMSQ